MTDRPTLVFAHANGFPGGSYTTFLAPFREHFHVEVMDRMGHDPLYPVDANWESLSRELEAKLAQLPRPFVGMGHSMGGVMMCMVASRRPDWFQALVMLDPPLINGWQGHLFNLARLMGLGDRITPAGRSKGRRARWADRAEAEAYFLRRPFFQRLDPRCLADYLAAGLEVDDDAPGEGDAGALRLRYAPEVEVNVFRTTPGNIGRLPRLQVPGLMVSGAESEPMFLSSARRHVQRHGMVHRLAPGGHMFPLENPEAASDIILTGLQGLGVMPARDTKGQNDDVAQHTPA
ncbi:alpha/beta hydrolase [Alcanivorax sp. JB21]|uniref:alpha/beta fold hydrolase n=1 Tax=Alcanivorax limicola TaxID=2874102 RepID=UPI001CBC4606|nr:alpha/beta hydrolase [Alcanivorax limicola]MBZ2187645.1 alpha/beta hydrolase [Alcanivorax limicola]